MDDFFFIDVGCCKGDGFFKLLFVINNIIWLVNKEEVMGMGDFRL